MKKIGKKMHTKYKTRKRKNENEKETKKIFRFVYKRNLEAIREKEEKILELKRRKVICEKCGKEIQEISSSLSDKNSKKPVHFECVMALISKNERVENNDKIAYIGQGRFALLEFETIEGKNKFKIKKIIEWEEKGDREPWRHEIELLFSQVE